MTISIPHSYDGSKRVRGIVTALACCALVVGFPVAGFGQATSSWVYYDSHHNLHYAADAAGNRIIDYSSAG